jgi:hypothetical protein
MVQWCELFFMDGSVMGKVRHRCAITTRANRAAKHRLQAPTVALSRELGLKVKKVAKRRKRETFESRKTGPTQISSTALSSDEEGMIVTFHCHTFLSIDYSLRLFCQSSHH